MRHQFQSRDSRWWCGDWEVRSDRSSSFSLGRCEKLWLGTSPEWQLPPVWNIQDYPVLKLGSKLHSILNPCGSLFDLKIISLISQLLLLFGYWIHYPSPSSGPRQIHQYPLLNQNLMILFSLFSVLIWSKFGVCWYSVPGSGCDARLVRAGANFVHI